MSQKGPLPPLLISMANHVVPDAAPNVPYIPSVVEAANYYYGFPSKPRLVARSSCDVWMRPTGPEAYLVPKGLMPLGSHSLATVWEDIVSPALSRCLDEKEVNFLTMTPAHVYIVDQPSHPVVVLVGVKPGSLTHELGIEAAVACHSVLIANSILDVHVEIRESEPSLDAALYRPTVTSNPAACLIESFATSLGLPISFIKTTHYEGTAGFFFTDSAKPGKLFMLTACHVLFHPDETPNDLYVIKDGTGAPQRKVILLGKATFDAHVTDIEAAIRAKEVIVVQLAKRAAEAEALEDLDEAEAADEKEAVQTEMEKAEKAISAFKKLRADVLRDWKDDGSRVIGHVILSPPFTLNFGTDGYTKDWAVFEIHSTMISVAARRGRGHLEVSEFLPWFTSRVTEASTSRERTWIV
ncbi:hypothetical protein C8Q72DRAFT_882828 [Fomitopsis betulina]|nr:hypothetical protein C8Q72DRAFT_882828 [Fomitopsis betulina]